MTVPSGLADRRILVVEDDTLIAMMIEETLQELGCIVVGPVSKLDAVVRLAGGDALDGAVLDVNIRGGYVYPAAEVLQNRGVPFVLASGYGNWALPAVFQRHPRLTKPFTRRELETQVRRLCGVPEEVWPAPASPP